MTRARHLAEILLVCGLAAVVLYALLWVASWLPGLPLPALPVWAQEMRGTVPLSAFPWAGWAAYLIAFAALPAAWEIWRRRPAPSATPMGFVLPLPWRGEMVLAVALSVAVLAYVAAVAAAAHWRLARALIVGNAAFFAVNWAVQAVAEETLFRGFVQRRLARVFRFWPAILLAAAIWAFAGHWRSPAWENLYLRLPVGMALGWLYARSGSLLPPILAHWLINLGVTAGL